MMRPTPQGGRQRALLAGVAVLAVALLTTFAGAVTAATDREAPRIVSAVMLDRDRDGRGDGLRVTYSERVRHARDADGRYPFAVGGYPVLSIGGAQGRAVDILLREPAAADPAARPRIRYRPARRGSIRDVAGNAAGAQTLLATRGHGHRPAEPQPPAPTPPTPPTPPATPSDLDGDGVLPPADCDPTDPAIRPGTPDLPDLAFVDANCDGIDGDAAGAIFVSPAGRDDQAGTRAAPKRQIWAAIQAAEPGQAILAAAGSYDSIDLRTGISIYGGYDPVSWSRGAGTTSIAGAGYAAVRGQRATGVTLQLVAINGHASGSPGDTAYGLRLFDGSAVTLQRVIVTTGPGNAGAPGRPGRAGRDGYPGEDGKPGYCDSNVDAFGGAGGRRDDYLNGGDGGAGGYGRAGQPGSDGVGGGAGGAGGAAGDPGHAGAPGGRGRDGRPGAPGAGGDRTPRSNLGGWAGQPGGAGGDGQFGLPGGGGGGGGGQRGILVIDGTGNGGGGGGTGGDGGGAGRGGEPGGGSIGIYLQDSTVTITAGSALQVGAGGKGGDGGNGGDGGAGAPGGGSGAGCFGFVGRGGIGGTGGRGGRGGGGGGGAGGPSLGIYRVGTSTASISPDTAITTRSGGRGGVGGLGEPGPGAPGATGLAAPVHPA